MEKTEEEIKAEEEAKAKEEEEAKKKKEKEEESSEYLKSELKKVIEQRDTAKTDKRRLKDELGELRDKHKDVPDKDDIEALMDEVKELREFQKTITEKEEEETLKSASDLERKTMEFEKQFDKLKQEMADETTSLTAKVEKGEALLEENKVQIESLRGSKLEQEISRASIKAKAINPDQVVNLLKHTFSHDSDLDKFVFLERDAKGKLKDEKTVEEYVTEFLTKEENENLVEAKVNTSGMGTQASDTSTTTTTKKSPEGEYDPKDPEIIKSAEGMRLSVEDYIDVRKKRDAKMETIKNNRK